MEGTGRILPSSRLVLLLAEPLEQDVEYGVRVSSVVNINGLEGGGGEGTFVLEAPVPDTVAVDTMAVPPVDTMAVPPVDTMAVPPVDTMAVPPVDTLGAPSREAPTRPPREAPLGRPFPSGLAPGHAPDPAFRPARGGRR
jgi:hypothetical protein